ncbi:MAG: hypothetical protein HKP00_10705 [Flavobacteriaceae bacterium]|nr:hypothetical protein [Flavobacteriaceae bacterium]NNK61074.1 hypothetical protein [Flavobacteriaceae bacterium]
MLSFKSLKLLILKVFDLKEEELHHTLLLQLNIFLIITTLLVVKPTINSLFLSELTSDALPLGFVLTAIVAVLGSYFYSNMLERMALNVIVQRTLITSILSLIIFGVAFTLDFANGYWLYIPYVWVAIFGLLSASQFWILANLVYNAREAKRVFGFIGAGAIAGGIFGGYLTSILTRFLDTNYLFFVAAFLLLGCLPITRYIWHHHVDLLNTFQVSKRSSPKAESPLRLIRKSKLLSLIAIVIGISVLIAKLVDYQYSDFASRLIQDPEELASFFGFWFSTLSVISLLIQLFLTQRLVGTFGVGTSLIWLPTGILLGSFLLIIIPQLWVIVLIKVIDGSLKQSVNKAATELLSIPIPIDIKKKTKTFSDVVVDSIATGLAGFILIFLINGLDLPAVSISLIIILLICGWLYVIYKLRIEYIIAFKALFTITDSKKPKEVKEEIHITSIISTVIQALKSNSENKVIHMLNKTLEVKDERFFFSIKDLIKHESAKVRALAIENLYFLKTENLSTQMEIMINDDDQEVTEAAFRYLLKNYNKNTVDLFEKHLNTNDHTIANSALVGLSLEIRNNITLQHRFDLEHKIELSLKSYRDDIGHELKNNRIKAILQAIGNAQIRSFYPVIKEHLKSKDTDILNTAITSASRTLDQDFINLIIHHLSGRSTRKTATEALVFYNEPIIKIIYEGIKKEQILTEDAVYAIKVIENFASQKAVNTLISLTEISEHSVKIEAIEALKRLKWKHSHLQIKDRFIIDNILDECQLYQDTLAVIHSQIVIQYKKKQQTHESKDENDARVSLIELLESRLDRQLQRIFRFLGIKYPPNDVDPILNTILHGKEEQRIHAIEFLDNILDKQLKKELIPVAESILIDLSLEDKIKKLNLKVFSEAECYHALLSRNDVKLKLTVLNLIEKTQNLGFKSIVESVLNDKNGKVRTKAEELSKLG